MAWAIDGHYVAEAARDYLEACAGAYTEADLPLIWAKQQEAEDAARASSASFVVCDTGPEVIRIWAEVKYGRCPEHIIRATHDRRYDLILLCQPDLPWAPDPLREAPNEDARRALFERYVLLLGPLNPVIVAGVNRLEMAMKEVRRKGEGNS